MFKTELQTELHNQGLDTSGKVSELKSRLQDYLSSVERDHRLNVINVKHVLFTHNDELIQILPGFITKGSNEMFIMFSDDSRKLNTVTVSSDGVLIKGDVTELGGYAPECSHIISLAVK